MGGGRRVPSLVEGTAAASSSGLFAASRGPVKLMPQHAAPLPEAPPPTALEIPARKKRVKACETAGAGWGNMKAPELTKEVKRELLVLKMRGVLDPKKFYRSSDHKKGLPKFFQVGTVIDGGETGQISKRQRKQSMLNEMMNDEKVKLRAKSQFLKVQSASMQGVKKSRPPTTKRKFKK
mmetsp:Transcript_19141/g.40773  ORF Transcript_19141/g.40773 Transcript_19141/m.40773 type:complete len:179 (-) Transcript_19141:175-711(-)